MSWGRGGMAAAAGQGGGAKRAAEGEAAGGAPAKRAAILGADKEVGEGGASPSPSPCPPPPPPAPAVPAPPVGRPFSWGAPDVVRAQGAKGGKLTGHPRALRPSWHVSGLCPTRFWTRMPW